MAGGLLLPSPEWKRRGAPAKLAQLDRLKVVEHNTSYEDVRVAIEAVADTLDRDGVELRSDLKALTLAGRVGQSTVRKKPSITVGSGSRSMRMKEMSKTSMRQAYRRGTAYRFMDRRETRDCNWATALAVPA